MIFLHFSNLLHASSWELEREREREIKRERDPQYLEETRHYEASKTQKTTIILGPQPPKPEIMHHHNTTNIKKMEIKSNKISSSITN